MAYEPDIKFKSRWESALFHIVAARKMLGICPNGLSGEEFSKLSILEDTMMVKTPTIKWIKKK